MSLRTWLIVGKPLRPPFRDGSTVLIRDLVRSMPEERGLCYLGDPEAPLRAGDAVIAAPAVGYAPRLADKGRALAAIVRRPGAPVHLCFTPGRASAGVVAWLRRVQPRRHIIQSLMSSQGAETWGALLRPLDRVVALSQRTEKGLRAGGVEAERVVTIRPGVASVRAEAPEEVAGRRSVLYAGDLDEASAGRLVSLGRALGGQAGWSLTIACRPKAEGDRGARVRLQRELAGELASGRVTLMGEVVDMDELYRRSALQVFAATHTRHKVDLPLVLLEGLARGVPVAVVESPAAEIVEVAAEAGSPAGAVVPEEPEAFARAIVAVCRGEGLARWSEGARRAAELEFSLGRMARRYEELYAELDARAQEKTRGETKKGEKGGRARS